MAAISAIDENKLNINIENITCKTCNVTVNLSSGSRRTVCPNCGNFYVQDAASNLTLRSSSRSAVRDNDIDIHPNLTKVYLLEHIYGSNMQSIR